MPPNSIFAVCLSCCYVRRCVSAVFSNHRCTCCHADRRYFDWVQDTCSLWGDPAVHRVSGIKPQYIEGVEVRHALLYKSRVGIPFETAITCQLFAAVVAVNCKRQVADGAFNVNNDLKTNFCKTAFFCTDSLVHCPPFCGHSAYLSSLPFV